MPLNEMVINKGYLDVNPVLFGEQRCKKGHHYGPAIRDYWLLHFVVSGKGIFRIRDREYTVFPDSFFVIPPFVETYYEADGADPWEYVWVGFTARSDLDLFPGDVMHLPAARSIFSQMRSCREKNGGKTEYLAAMLWQLFSEILEHNPRETDRIEKAKHIIRAEYMTGLFVEEIALRVGMDRSRFSSLFKERTGLSPKEYLQKIRMEAAKALLQSGVGVTVTAHSVGYGDVYVFSKMFKRYFGIAPSRFAEKRGT